MSLTRLAVWRPVCETKQYVPSCSSPPSLQSRTHSSLQDSWSTNHKPQPRRQQPQPQQQQQQFQYMHATSPKQPCHAEKYWGTLDIDYPSMGTAPCVTYRFMSLLLVSFPLLTSSHLFFLYPDCLIDFDQRRSTQGLRRVSNPRTMNSFVPTPLLDNMLRPYTLNVVLVWYLSSAFFCISFSFIFLFLLSLPFIYFFF